VRALSCGGQTPPKRAWVCPEHSDTAATAVLSCAIAAGYVKQHPVEKLALHGLCLDEDTFCAFEGGGMQDILKTLDTLTNDELEAVIDRAEAILQGRLAKVPLREDPAIGMWADREDMKDSAAWVHKLRQGGVSDDRG
jgi:hypothetical protein